MRIKEKIVAPVILEQSSLIELIVIAIFLAFGVNLISDSIPLLTNLSPTLEFIIGIVLCFVAILYLVARFLGKRQQKREFSAFFIYNQKQNFILNIPRYDFAENIERYLKAAFIENNALKVIWEKEPLSGIWKNFNVQDGKGVITKVPRSKKLIAELVEYYVLEKLSTHLTDYFAHGNFAEKNLREYNRKDIPDVLLSNRFLELFSKPMEDRPQFIEQALHNRTGGVIVSSGSKNGAFYQKFDLMLPKHSIIQRPEPNVIEINTNRIKILVQVKFDGYGTVLPDGFSESYLGIKNSEYFEIFSELKVIIEVKVEFNFGALLSTTGWEYYHWVDSFLDKLSSDISEDEFFSRLNWENAYTIYMMLQKGKEKATR